jgi:5'(3')-deoxyribonucleotidase
VITGVFRIKEWSNDRKVSRPELSFVFGSVFGLMTYVSAFYATATWVPWTLVILSIVAIFVYREIRRRLGYPRLLVVGVDVDGVLGDQVSHVLNRLHGMGKAADIQKHNITDWNYPLDGTDIALEIENALLDKRFVKEMPVVPGSIDSMEHLHKKFHAVIATSRPNETEPETIEWLRRNFEFHEYVNARDIGKENLGLDVLIDDNIDNVKAFAASSHYALLLSQPWNRNEDDVIKGLLKSKKVIRCSDWNDVEKRLDEIQKILSARV